jgi:hypothetical protein
MGLKRHFQRGKYSLQRLYHRTATGKWPPQIIFMHVPKTAGTSVQVYFSGFMGSRRKNKIISVNTIFEDASPEAKEVAKTARYVGGHLDWKTFEEISHPDTFLFTILRDPVDRFLSSYFFLQEFPPYYEGQEIVKHIKGMPFEEFCVTQDKAVRAFTDNILSRQFSGDLKRFPESEAEVLSMTETAISHLPRFNHIGFQHRLEEALHAIAQKANLLPPTKIFRKNVTKKPASGSHPLPAITRDDVLRLAAPRLLGDLKIYEAAQTLETVDVNAHR